MWGRARIVEHVATMRDSFKCLHDQTLRLANRGYTRFKLAEMIERSPSLQANRASHSSYGRVNHDVKAVDTVSLGWFDANPGSLHALPPVAAAKTYVESTGGAGAVFTNASQDFAKGESRVVAQIVNPVVFADLPNQAARARHADAREQLGCQAEHSLWRHVSLQGALARPGRRAPTYPARGRRQT